MLRPLAAAAVCAVALIATGASTAALDRPTLQVRSITPLRLSGSNFRSGEHVRLTLSGAFKTRVRILSATHAGRFTVDFGRVALDPCEGDAVVVRAVGASGSRAAWKRACKPAHRYPG